MLARWAADRCGQPSVLGELLLGIVIGNVGYSLGIPLFALIMHLDRAESAFNQMWAADDVGGESRNIIHSDSADLPERFAHAMNSPDVSQYLTAALVLSALASLGILILLFLAGLESNVRKMAHFWRPSVCVAAIGVVAPFVLGFASCFWLHPSMSTVGHLFLAATLAATSVGITVRVFEDLNQLHSREANVILGAAVIDDVLGLILLAVVVSVATTGTVEVWHVLRVILVASVFLTLILTCGEWLVGWGARIFQTLDRKHSKLLYPLALAFGTAWLADAVELAPIIGAFSAGLIINERQFAPDDSTLTIQQQIAPLERLLAPVFFVVTGMQVNLGYFLETQTLLLSAAITVAAVAGKVSAGLFAGRDLDRLSVGLGMVPRGEVGLIFVSVGRGLRVVNETVFSALVVMVVVSTLVTPPALKWSMNRIRKRQTQQG